TSSDDEASIPSAGNRKQWQYAHCNMRSQGRGQGSRRSSKSKKHSKNSAELADDDPNTVKSFPPTSCEGLLEKMCTAIYLSLDEFQNITITEISTIEEEECDSLSAELCNSFL
ncbi:14346_t:CDS:2, partial [Dentiscutata erythropus]